MDLKSFLSGNLKDFEKIGSKEKRIIIAFIAGLFILSFGLSLGLQKLITSSYKQPEAEIVISPSPIPQPASISLLSDKSKVMVGEDIKVDIVANSPDQGIEAAGITINFDPDFLVVKEIINAGFFKKLIKQDVFDQKLSISAIADISDRGILIPKGQGNIAHITFNTLSATDSTKISFDGRTTSLASNGINIINQINDLVISIK
jgi:hypothetical protein